jgi:putative membrane protein
MPEFLQSAVPYLAYLLSALMLLAVFLVLYTRVTRFDELKLIREGNTAAAFSLGGAVLGFSCTLAFSIALHASWHLYLLWSVAAMVVQVIAYALAARLMRNMNAAIHEGNTAMGGMMGAVSLGVGLVNAACLT